MSKYTIKDIFRLYGDEYLENNKLSKEQLKVFDAILKCGTENLGFHVCTCIIGTRGFLLYNYVEFHITESST